jgi:hypothetical protein
MNTNPMTIARMLRTMGGLGQKWWNTSPASAFFRAGNRSGARGGGQPIRVTLHFSNGLSMATVRISTGT